MIALPEWIDSSEEPNPEKDRIVIGKTPDGKPISIPSKLTPHPSELDDDVVARIHRKVMAVPPEQRNPRIFRMIVAAETFTIFHSNYSPHEKNIRHPFRKHISTSALDRFLSGALPSLLQDGQ